jgi:putative membrane protein
MTPNNAPGAETEEPIQAPRKVRGGLLMGLANLVPGISGGTMLLSAGVYPAFIEGIAEVSTLRFRLRTLLSLGLIVGSAALAIGLFAGVVKNLVVDHRWAMYSIFIGLTLGGVPLIWKLLKPATKAAWVGCAAGFAVMALMATIQPGASDPGAGPNYTVLFFAGLAGASAMILPGVSGGYLLLILGQYLTILGAIDQAKTALLAQGGPQWDLVIAACGVFIPVGLGVVAGVVGVSNLIRLLLRRFEKATLGVLLGLLLGAVLGLWPFQQGVPPRAGDVLKGRILTAEQAAAIEPDDYRLDRYSPPGWQVGASLALALAGFGITQGIAQLGAKKAAGQTI